MKKKREKCTAWSACEGLFWSISWRATASKFLTTSSWSELDGSACGGGDGCAAALWSASIMSASETSMAFHSPEGNSPTLRCVLSDDASPRFLQKGKNKTLKKKIIKWDFFRDLIASSNFFSRRLSDLQFSVRHGRVLPGGPVVVGKWWTSLHFGPTKICFL